MCQGHHFHVEVIWWTLRSEQSYSTKEFTSTALSCVQGHWLSDTMSWNVITTVRLFLESSLRSFTKSCNFYLNLGSNPETLSPSSHIREDWGPGHLCQTTQRAKYYNLGTVIPSPGLFAFLFSVTQPNKNPLFSQTLSPSKSHLYATTHVLQVSKTASVTAWAEPLLPIFNSTPLSSTVLSLWPCP